MGGNKSRRDSAKQHLGDAGGSTPASTALVRPPASRDLRTTIALRTAEQIDAEAERVYGLISAELDADNPRRCVGELTDRMIKILRLRSERIDRDDLRASIEALVASNRELSARLAGGAGGAAVTRADTAPAFRPADAERTH